MKNKITLFLVVAMMLVGCQKSNHKSSSTGDESSFYSESSSQSSEETFSSSEEEKEYDQSKYYDGYYSSIVSWENGDDLKQQLHSLISGEGYAAIPYVKSSTANWQSNALADQSLNDFDFVDAVYSSDDISKGLTQKGWQREHAFCATLMTGSLSGKAVEFLGRATDFHNLFAAGSFGNNSRGNKNFGMADKTAEGYTNATTNNGEDGYSYDTKNFEPGNRDKGRLARAIFYMATMYCETEYDEKNDVNMKGLTIVEDYVNYTSGNDCAFAIGNLSTLLNWNNYTVDYLEMQHNISVYSDTITIGSSEYKQGNRNPYVDYPELVDYVYGDKKEMAGELKYIVPSAETLHMDSEEIDHYAISSAVREYTYGETLTSSDYTVVAAKKNFTFENVTSGVTNSLDNHTFNTSDGDSVEAVITVNGTSLKYNITLGAMSTCSYQSGLLTKDGLSVNTTSNKTYNEKTFNVTPSGDSGMAFSNVTSGGVADGFSMGSGTANKGCNGITITSVEQFTINKAYIKCRANNKSSTFTLKVMVGDVTVLDNITIKDNDSVCGEFGGEFVATTGTISFIITGSNALRINSFAFNIVE